MHVLKPGSGERRCVRRCVWLCSPWGCVSRRWLPRSFGGTESERRRSLPGWPAPRSALRGKPRQSEPGMNRGAQTWDCGALGREEEEEGGGEGVDVKRRRSTEQSNTSVGRPLGGLVLTQRVCAGRCFADQAKAGGAGTRCSGGESLAVGRGWRARLGQWRLGLIHLSASQAIHNKPKELSRLPPPGLFFCVTCEDSLAFPGVGLRGLGVDGASPAFEEPAISFLRLGARSSPFPCGE